MKISRWAPPLLVTLVLVGYDVVSPVVGEGLRQQEVHNEIPQYNPNCGIVAEISGSQSTNEEAAPEVRIPIEYLRENDEKTLRVFKM